MAKKSDIEGDTVRKSTMLMVAFIALGVGFLGGVVFSAFKTGSGISTSVPGPPPAPQQQAAQEQSVTEEQAKRMLTLEREVSTKPENVD